VQNSDSLSKKMKDLAKANRQQDTWVTLAAKALKHTQDAAESKIKTVLTCRTINKKNVLFVPADMAELQPRSLRYLHKFAAANEISLIEDRRKIQAQPIIEKRSLKDPMMVLGMSMLLKQSGMPGPARSLSEPHRLNPENPFFSINTLIDMAAFSAAKAKCVVLPPNRITLKALNNDTQPISGYACNIKTDDTTILLSHFESDNFRAIGYSAGNQFVFHLCLGGGTLQNPTLWAESKSLMSTDFRFQLFAAQKPADDYGLFYSTFYLDLSQAPFPGWLTAKPATNDELHIKDEVA
jgi:molybdopterin-guanine dinucleotide biosynthesis protein A